MSQVVEVDVKQRYASTEKFTLETMDQLRHEISESTIQLRLLREAVQELDADPSKGTPERLGLGLYLIGRFSRAEEVLSGAGTSAIVQFYLAKTKSALEKFGEADELYQKAAKGGFSTDLCSLGRAESLRLAGSPRQSLSLLDNLSGAVEQTAEYLYQRGATVAMLGGNPKEVIALYTRAVDVDPTHAGALFGLALENDRRGNDETAVELYRRSVERYPAHIGALLNLGLLYEDMNSFERAKQCYKRVLDSVPDHSRARLFFKDAMASSSMFYDEDAQKRRDRLSQVLNIPVTDFELSVRSRNCLQKMGVMTLGDLTRTTEQELLASKNFGETSLAEIKEMLVSKKLSLGQFSHEKQEPFFGIEPTSMTPDEQEMLTRPIADLNFSVRARKCMVRLGINTVGELIRKSGDDLLECKNFGVTSLKEVREKLTEQGLKLRGD